MSSAAESDLATVVMLLVAVCVLQNWSFLQLINKQAAPPSIVLKLQCAFVGDSRIAVELAQRVDDFSNCLFHGVFLVCVSIRMVNFGRHQQAASPSY